MLLFRLSAFPFLLRIGIPVFLSLRVIIGFLLLWCSLLFWRSRFWGTLLWVIGITITLGLFLIRFIAFGFIAIVIPVRIRVWSGFSFSFRIIVAVILLTASVFLLRSLSAFLTFLVVVIAF
ncbi:hypothetical protein D3C72_1185040 [compost metagenome]